MIELLIIFIWWLIGAASFTYWWTKDSDFEVFTVLLAAIIGLIGPVAFVLGWFVHGSYSNRVLIKRRK